MLPSSVGTQTTEELYSEDHKLSCNELLEEAVSSSASPVQDAVEVREHSPAVSMQDELELTMLLNTERNACFKPPLLNPQKHTQVTDDSAILEDLFFVS